jgi:hypothetical protein
MKTPISVRIEINLWNWVRKYCKKNGLTVTGLITRFFVDLRNKNK